MKWLKRISIFVLSLSLLIGGYVYYSSPQQAQAAAGPQIFYTRNIEAAPTQSTRFLPLNGTGAINIFATSTFGVLPIAGTFSNMTATVDTAPGGAASWTVTLFDNNAATGHTCTITSAITSCTAAGTYSATAGHSYYIKLTGVSVPAATYMRASIQFTPTSAGHTAILFSGNTNLVNTTAAQWAPFIQNNNWNLPESQRTSIFPESGTFQNLYASASAAPTAGKSYIYTIRNSSATTTLACTIADTNKDCSDLSDAPSIAANTTVDVNAMPNGSPTVGLPGFGLDFVPNNAGDFVLMTAVNASNSTSLTSYYTTPGSTISTIEASTTQIAQAMTVTGIAVNLATSPGSGKSRLYTLRQNGADTGITCTVAGTGGHICSGTGSVTLAAGDTFDVSESATSTPAASSGNSIALIANTNTGGGGGTPAVNNSSAWFEVINN